MSERLPYSPEKTPGADPELEVRRDEALRDLHEKARNSEHEHENKLEQIRHKAEQEAAASEKIKAELSPERPDNDKPLHINHDLKEMSYRRTMKRTRSHLPPLKRPLSKFIHQPAVEALSEFGSKTIARPSGILVGGIAACIGSALVLWISRHYGYEYNFLLFALLFVGGYFVGLVLELMFRLSRKRK